MSCSEWEREIASELESAELEDHLRVCGNCRQFARELVANRAALLSMALNAHAFDVVRRRVLTEIQDRKRRPAWWMWPVAAAACVAVLYGGLLWPRFEIPGPPAVAAFTKAPPKIEWTSTRPRPAALAVRAEPLVVKMLTNDPTVIIIWLVDQKGD